ncbi:MAG TPA: trehalose-6-phosphate synthase [Thermoanaerobaculia bacterium]|nr:trehalose-6-phosphate synthase [Thermoanaerobaculia bacterium]
MPKRRDLVIVSNRLPVHRVERDGKASWEISPGGLVSALTPVLAERDCTWIGWSGDAGEAPEPFGLERIHNVPVALSKDDIENYYEGFSNRTLWPLYHDAVRPPQYHRHWWRPYVEVNRRFAAAAAAHAKRGGTVWVHDYHLQLVPRMLRASRPDLRIGYFLHIPFPPAELFAQLPWRGPLLDGLLGADVVGFQTRGGARNFAALARRHAGASASGHRLLAADGHTTLVKAFPVSIDVDHWEALARRPDLQERARQLRERIGSPRRLLLGVDRLDYTKGIDIRLRAFGELLARDRGKHRDCKLVQLAVPSRERVEEYAELRTTVEQLVGRINGDFEELGSPPVHYLHRSLPAEELVAGYLAADVLVVTPLRDGMNLVAKEYVACRVDDDGVLVLSEFTGAAHQFNAALRVNPHDIDGLVEALDRALEMPLAEARRRMRKLRRTLRAHDVHRWGREFLEALAA